MPRVEIKCTICGETEDGLNVFPVKYHYIDVESDQKAIRILNMIHVLSDLINEPYKEIVLEANKQQKVCHTCLDAGSVPVDPGNPSLGDIDCPDCDSK